MPRTARVLLPATLLIALTGASLAQPPAHEKPTATATIPDTDRARCIRDFIEMVNNPTPESVKSFESRWASPKRAGSATLDERVQRMKDLHEKWGTVAIVQARGRDADLAILAKSKIGMLEIRPEFSDADKSKLDGMMIADGPGVQESRPLTAADRAAVVEHAASALRESYVYPEVGEAMAKDLTAKLKAGAYDAVDDEMSLASRLTADCRAISNDKHLGIQVAAQTGPGGGHDSGPSTRDMQAENYAFHKVEILPGNIGYLKFDLFIDSDEARATAASAMAFLSHCDAIIFDLRSNGGGSPAMIQFITSYLFDQPQHLNDMVDRNGKIVEEYWTLKDVPGRRLAKDLPVYVLTSSRTFSGAEEFSYNLQNLERATLVGETTGGGAHPIRPERLSDRFVMRVPYMRAQNPVTHRNWEGTGVEPEVKVPAAEALDRAQALARAAIEKRSPR